MQDAIKKQLNPVGGNPAPATPAQPTEVKVVYTSIGKDTITKGKKWGDMVIDVESTFRTMVQDLMFGKQVIVSHTSMENVEDFVRKLKLQLKLYTAEGVAFSNGAAYLSITKTPAGTVAISLANPSFPNRVIYMGDTKIGAEIWEVIQTDRAPFYMRTTYTTTKITRTIFDGFGKDKKQVDMDELSRSSIPKALLPKPTEENKLKFIPVEVIYFRQPQNYSNTAIDEVRGLNAIRGVQNFLNETSYAWRKELHNNSTKVLLDQGMLDQYTKEQQRNLHKADWLLALDGTGSSDGSGKQIEIMMGNPKLKEYHESFSAILTSAAEAIKLSTLGVDTGSSSATEAIFTKANDVETTNTLRVLRGYAIADLLEKAKLMDANIPTNEWEINSSDWTIQINPNIIMNEAKLTDTLIKQHSVGAIDLPTMVSELKGVSKEQARDLLDGYEAKYDKEEPVAIDMTSEKDNDMSNSDITDGE